MRDYSDLFLPGQRVRANAQHRKAFPNSRAHRGWVIGRASEGPLRTVKWDDLATPHRLHLDFLAVETGDGDQPLTEDKRADLTVRI